LSLFIETFGQEKLALSHDEVVEFINSAEGLTAKDRHELLADWGEVSGKGVGGQHFEMLNPDEEKESKKSKGKSKSKKETAADEG
jgi:hypothetical protein